MRSLALFDSKTHRPSQSQGLAHRWLDLATFGVASKGLQVAEKNFGVTKVKAATTAGRECLEAGLTGVSLGLVGAHGGLDRGPGRKIPVDGTVSGLALVASIFGAGNEIGQSLRVVGTSSLAIFTQRKTESFFKDKRATGGKSSMHGEGDYEDDPIVAAGRAAGM